MEAKCLFRRWQPGSNVSLGCLCGCREERALGVCVGSATSSEVKGRFVARSEFVQGCVAKGCGVSGLDKGQEFNKQTQAK